MKAVAIGIVVALGLPSAAAAQETYLGQLRAQITAAATALRDVGFEPVPDQRHTGRLAEGAQDSRLFTLTAGVLYAIVGVCDEDCSDLDLRAFAIAPDTGVVAEDLAPDDQPVVEFIPRVTGNYRVMIGMATCATSPCYWGLQLFRKTR